MDISRFLRAFSSGTGPGPRTANLTPISPTAGGWLVQVDGRRLFARTDLSLVPGTPLKAKVIGKDNNIHLQLTPQQKDTPQTLLSTAIGGLGLKADPQRIEKLIRWLPRAPGSSDREKAGFLVQLDEKGLLHQGVFQGLQDLLDSAGGNSQRQHKEHKKQDDLDENKVQKLGFKTSEAQAAVDLFNRLDPSKPGWILVPFRWQNDSIEIPGLSKFLIEPVYGNVLRWSFSLGGTDEAWLVTEIPHKTLTVFTDRARDIKTLDSLGLGPVTLRPRDLFDGFNAVTVPGIFSVDSYA